MLTLGWDHTLSYYPQCLARIGISSVPRNKNSFKAAQVRMKGVVWNQGNLLELTGKSYGWASLQQKTSDVFSDTFLCNMPLALPSVLFCFLFLSIHRCHLASGIWPPQMPAVFPKPTQKAADHRMVKSPGLERLLGSDLSSATTDWVATSPCNSSPRLQMGCNNSTCLLALVWNR